MKSFIRAITITIVLNLLLTGSTTAQTVPDTVTQRVSEVVEDTHSHLDETLSQLRTLLSAGTQQYGGGKVLVIPTAEIKPQDLVTMMEDMTVMCRIFDKKLAQSHLIPGQFLSSSRIRLSMPFSQDSRSTGAMYVQGYGTLFLTKVDFPLSPPPKKQEEKKTKEEDADPVWEQMKQEIFRPEEVGRRRSDRPEEKYDADKVENLKTTYIIALKHAANIRGLKPDESVILTVTGKVSQSGPLVTRVYSSWDGKYVVNEPGAATGSFSPTVLTIRAKKADIDAFAKGKLSFDQFHQKTQVLSYPYLGGNVSGPSRSSTTNMIYRGSSDRRIR